MDKTAPNGSCSKVDKQKVAGPLIRLLIYIFSGIPDITFIRSYWQIWNKLNL